MFDRSMERERSGTTNQAEARSSTMKSGPPSSSSSVSRNQSTPSRLSAFAGSAMGLDRTLSTPPVAESTHIGSTSFSSAWNGTSIGGQSKRRPTSPLLNNRTLFKSSGNLTGIGRANSRVLTDAQSPGLVNRLVRYYDRSQSHSMNRSQSLSSVYNKPGQFPLVQLRKQELRYANTTASRRNGNFSMVRIAPPDRSLFHTTKRSSIFRSGSLLLPTTNESASETSLFGGLGSTRNGPTGSGGGGGGGDEADVENRVITPCAELEATPTRSVLDALKEISRKRINSEELDADRIKKQCQELSELDAAGSGPPSSTAAVAIGTHGMATKRTREQASESSPSSSPPELGPGLGGVGRVPSSGGEQQSQKKRLCIKNNDILSSLSSSLVTMNTPKRTMVPRAERRFNVQQAASISMSSPAIGPMPTSSSTMVGLATPEKFSNMALNTPESLRRSESPREANGHPNRTSSNIDHWKQPVRGASKEPMEQATLQHRVPPKITLFNRPYETAISSSSADKSGSPSARGTSRIIASDGEEDEHGEGSGKVQFVRPKEKSPNDVTLSGSGTSGFSSSRDPLKKPAPSKLTVMLKCLSGDLDDYEEEEEQPPPRLPQALTQSRAGFSLGRSTSANDTVDAMPKELPTSVASKPVSLSIAETVVPPVSTPSPPSSTVTNGLSALINNPIKDTGLSKIASTASKEPNTGTTAAKPNEEKTPVITAGQQSDAAKSLTFTFGSGSTTPAAITLTPPKTTASTGFTIPVKPTTTTAAEQSSPVATATTFTFGIPTQKTSAPSSSSPLAAMSNSSLISFSPVTVGKLPAPVLQFGGSPVSSSTVTTTAAPTSTPTFSFTGGVAPKTMAPAAATTTTITSPQMTSSASLPTFGAGSTFGGFKLPASLTIATSASSGQPQTNTNSSTTIVTVPTTSAATAAVSPAFNFGFSSAASNKPAASPNVAIPTFGSGSFLNSTVVSTVDSSPITITPAVAVAGSGAFTFGGVTTTPNAAPVSTFTFGAAAAAAKASPTAAGTNSAVSSSVAPTTTFPTFGSLAGSTGPAAAAATTTSNASGTVTNQSTTPAQPFMFGGVKPTPATTPNLFGAGTTATSSAPSDGNSGGKTNLFAAAATQPQPNAASSIFGSVVAGQASTAGNTTTGSSIFGGATGATATGTAGASPSPFTFGATKAVTGSPAPTNGAPNNALGGAGSIFGNAASISSPAGVPATTGGIFAFGSTKPTAATGTTQQNTATAPQQQQQPNASTALSNTQVIPTFGAGTGTATNATPFTFGAVANKAPAGTTPGSGIFGSMSNTGNPGTVGGNTSTSALPTFGAGAMNGTGPVPTFGGGSIFGNTARPGTSTPSAQNPTASSMFGATQPNGPQSVSNNAGPATAPTAPSGGLFTFGATNSAGSNNNNASPGTFGTTGAGVASSGNTFGGFNATGGSLANGIGTTNQTTPNKPFTFGATNTNAGGTMSQNNLNAHQQATPNAPSGFNFNLGSNAAKPFNFTGGIGSVNTNGNVASPPMFGSPLATGNTNPASNASPFTFGAMVNGGNSTGGNNTSATPGPFTFGASAGQQGPGAGGGVTSPFNFSAGNVATVAPQPQQQPGAAFNFGGNPGGQQQQQPFGMVGGVTQGFGAPPAFGAPGVVPGGGVMPTFSIGTNSTPNGPPVGQRRIKVATRRVK